MMSDFEPWESKTGGKPEDNPLSVFDPADGGGGVSNGGMNNNISENSGTVDLLGTGSSVGADAPRVEEEIIFGGVEGNMEEYNLNNDDNAESEGDDASSGGEDLLDMQGWNLRQHRSDPEGEGADESNNAGKSEEHGIDNKTPNMEANVNGERNNSRRGLFGRWGSRRSNTSTSIPASTSAKSFESSNTEDSYNKVPRDGVEEATLAYGEGGITGDVDNDVVIDEELEDEQKMDNHLRPGDHIYIWQTYGINPRAYQRHAVVFSITRSGDVDPMTLPAPDVLPIREEEPLSFDMNTLHTEDEDNTVEVTVVSFYHLNRLHQNHGAAQAAQAQSGTRSKRSGSKREFLIDFIGPDGLRRKKPIHKVRYGRKVKKGLLSQKAGVGTALKKDQVGLISARVQYLLDHPDHMPAHNAMSSNGECASLWCVTGRWCTLQGASILAIMSVGQAGGALVAGGILSNLTLLVPMPGMWGMAGWWWYVPATVAYPFLVPMLVALGMCSLVPLEILRRNRKKWRGITDGLNHEFWSGASEATKEEYFGIMATAEKEAEMRSFFGVRDNDKSADDARYMPVGEAPGGMDDDDDEDEALAMQQMEKSCQNMAADMNVDLSGKPPSESGSPKGGGAWGSFMGSFRRKDSAKDDLTETQRFRTASDFS
eukprot:CAMPEP_0201930192 /NCGR_PEP_ID=MMETSP0903-20130614/24663_1 /ASSEMBLY_ACC=CAM_ASM_000552 /TAXON_ID=420261 /ORGANISM="Thalassiosira antarctica, Strain CCMP982" /LENGTH=653 /DNA_ID=CAMNT_0048469201 /DNA_START=10 /DNA_END=1971 /DNA_ORIENTATION=+